ncbi:hypothetical protein BsWGS_15994 [Bradybaena similaris]
MASVCERKAVGKANQSPFENDELLKSLGTQLNVHFSKYDQWQRRERTVKSSVSTEKCPESRKIFKIGAAPRAQLVHSVSAPVGKSKGRRALAKLVDEQRKQKEAVDVLELRIKHSKQTTDLYSKRAKELIEINLDIIKTIENQEHAVYAEVKRLLRKYEKFRGSIVALNSNFTKEISEVKRDLEATKERIKREIEALEQSVDKLDRKLKIKQEEVQFLRAYKDKEYPVKELMISKLQMEIESIKNLNQEDQEELEHIIDTELGKYGTERIRFVNNIICKTAEESVARIPPGLEKMALQNMLMKKEINAHKMEQANFIESNRKLQQEVAMLLKHPKSNLRLQVFPELFPTKEKCDPNADVILDLPVQEWILL